MKKTILFRSYLLIMIILLALGVNAEFRSDEDINMLGNEVYNASFVNATTIYMNDVLVSTIGNAWNVTGSLYITNISNKLDVNETKLNNTINTSFSANGSYMILSYASFSWNETKGNSTYINENEESGLDVNRSDYWDDLDTPADINAGDITDDGTYILSSAESGLDVNSSIYWGNLIRLTGIYLYNNSGNLTLNETKLNETINASFTAGKGVNLTGTVFSTNDTYISSLYVNRTRWTSIDDYPSDCSSGFLVKGLADTNTCQALLEDSLYLSYSGYTLSYNETKLNETIINITATITYLPVAYNVTSGTTDEGNLTSIRIINDGMTLNVSESSGANPLIVLVNFTGVTDFNNLIIREFYKGGAGHEILVQVWNYVTSAWDTHIILTDQSDFTLSVATVIDATTNHISGGLVQIRFFHLQNGIAFHDFIIDYVALDDGFTSVVASDHDALSGRDETSNHPWALPRDGTKNMSGDLNLGGFEFANGLMNWTFLQNYPGACPAGSFVTTIGDSLTCTAPNAADVDTGSFPVGSYVFSVLFINSSLTSLNWTNVSGTSDITSLPALEINESQIVDITPYVNNVTATAPITSSGTVDPNINITILKDIVAGNGLTGGEDNVLPGGDADTTLTMGTPGQTTNATTNAVSASSHTHSLNVTDGISTGLIDLGGNDIVNIGCLNFTSGGSICGIS